MRSLLKSGTCTKSQNASDIIGTRLQGAEDSSITADHSAYKQGQNCFGIFWNAIDCESLSQCLSTNHFVTLSALTSGCGRDSSGAEAWKIF